MRTLWWQVAWTGGESDTESLCRSGRSIGWRSSSITSNRESYFYHRRLGIVFSVDLCLYHWHFANHARYKVYLLVGAATTEKKDGIAGKNYDLVACELC